MPPALSTYAHRIDNLYYFIFYVGLFAFVLIVAVIIYFCVRYRRKGEIKKTPAAYLTNRVNEWKKRMANA